MKSQFTRILAICLLFTILSGCHGAQAPDPSVSETVETSAPTEAVATSAPTEPETEPPTEPEPVAEMITEGVTVLVGQGNATSILSDGSYWSKMTISASATLAVESETPFSSLYIQWDALPGIYAITWDGGSIECGFYGFFHEYIRLPEAVNRVEFVFNDDSYHVLCDVQVLTEGTAPDGVQDWQPPCQEADILVFPTHSDDDVLFFGALISYYAIERGLTVQTAFMVEHTYYPERNHERLNGLWTMGIRHYPILNNAPDTDTHDINEAMSYYAPSNIEAWQVEQIRRFRPLVVVGHDFNGEYGNAGHKVNAYHLARAIESAADPEKFPESADIYGTWDTPKLYIHLYPENEILLDVYLPMENDPQGRSPFQVAEDAFRCHVSQHKWGYRVETDRRSYDCRPFGLYRTLVGDDTTADIMENIDIAYWRESGS